MPLTSFQAQLGRWLAKNRSEDSYVAGGAAILAAPESLRYSRDLDYFQDSLERVATAYQADHDTLIEHGCSLQIEISQPGYIRTVVQRGQEATKIEWARDSAWRFMPVIRSEEFGYQLHPVDLATNKVLALAGRNEVRDLVDTLYLHEKLLPLGPLVWAAVGKDPGFSPLSLLELLRRRGRFQREELRRLELVEPIDPHDLKSRWMRALDAAEVFVRRRPPDEIGCLYFDPQTKSFIDPDGEGAPPTVPHYGRPGGVLPRIVDA